MKRFNILALSLISFGAFSQNLIMNPELSTSKKVGSLGEIEKATSWSNANGGSVDLFSKNSCGEDVRIPTNFIGTEESDANYAGFTAFYDDERVSLLGTVSNLEVTSEKGYQVYSEYPQIELSEALIAGQTYFFSVYVSLADASGRSAEGLGAYFSKEKLAFENNRALEFTPQIVANKDFSNKSGWEMISGSYIATGGEKFVVIGAFRGTAVMNSLITSDKQMDNKRAYYYLKGASLAKGNGGDLDTDGDGVLDRNDDCPTVAGLARFNGCPLTKGDLEKIRLASEKILFTTGNAEIKKESFKELDVLAKILSDNPEIHADIQGHADSDGDAASNLTLSKARATSVRDYLISKGVPADNLTTKVYGETKPVATNATEEGKKQNRRVVIISTSYTLKK